ncbi:hypothetical protein [Pacificibacter marinus]|uniref:hypothetical protein n=1 Tax=Pacificibacter marinus TaxID=658057 RepID=UPI001C06E951|nr:hypothetical protein [Pacificibacter marinus]MBU2868674.1 hypothetical protein [Pacificibacter marinus]
MPHLKFSDALIVVDGFAALNADNYITTGLDQPEGDFTWIIVGKVSSFDTSAHLIGTYRASTSGVWIQHISGASGRLTLGSYKDVDGSPTYDPLAGPVGTIIEGETFVAAVRYNATTKERALKMMLDGSETSDALGSALSPSTDKICNRYNARTSGF